MNYKEAVEWLEGLEKYPEVSKFDLVHAMLEELGNPQEKMRFLHVTGTNGKGSTCAMVASILKEAGIQTGMMTSPHLFQYTERLKVNGRDISEEDFCELVVEMQKVCDKVVTKNNKMMQCLSTVLFAMALHYFEKQGVEVAVVEVGFGAKLDTTNVIQSEVSLITNVDLDHTHVLGNTREEIALDKAEIIKPNSICITTETNHNLIDIFAEKAASVHAKLVVVEPSDADLVSQNAKGQVFNCMEYSNLEIPLLGSHQLTNASLAVMCADVLTSRGLPINEFTIRQGLKKVKWPLRLEVVGVPDGPDVIIDAGHNPHGIHAARSGIDQVFKSQRKILIIGCSRNKDYQEMVRIACTDVDVVITTQAEYKPADSKELYNFIKSEIGDQISGIHHTHNVSNAMKKAIEIAQPEDLVMVLGGLYLGAETKQYLAS